MTSHHASTDPEREHRPSAAPVSYEYRIEYTIQRRDTRGDEDFVDIGFGSSGAWDTVDAAEHMAGSDIQNYGWETEGVMPDPDDVKADIDAARAVGVR